MDNIAANLCCARNHTNLKSYGANALVARAAKSLLAAARQHAVLAATAKAAEAELGSTPVGSPAPVGAVHCIPCSCYIVTVSAWLVMSNFMNALIEMCILTYMPLHVKDM
jgi:hypothetical protein